MAYDTRVVITGLGTVTALGLDVHTTWEALCAGRSGIGRLSGAEPAGRADALAAEVSEFDPLTWIDRKDAKKMDRFIQLAVVAADAAQAEAHVLEELPATAVGVAVAGLVGGFATLEREHAAHLAGRRLSPFLIPSIAVNLAAGWVSIRAGAKGPNAALATSGALALGLGRDWLRRGEARAVLAGAAEAPLTPLLLSGFAAARLLASSAGSDAAQPRPFDRRRRGGVLGEGGACVVLEPLAQARARGTRPYCELAGFAHVAGRGGLHPDAEATARVVRAALADAGLAPGDVSAVVAHAEATRRGDREEARGLRAALGERTPTVSAFKPALGHLLGAAAVLESALGARALRERRLPALLNCDEPDPECGLTPLRGAPLALGDGALVVHAFSPGGTHAALVLRPCDE